MSAKGKERKGNMKVALSQYEKKEKTTTTKKKNNCDQGDSQTNAFFSTTSVNKSGTWLENVLRVKSG